MLTYVRATKQLDKYKLALSHSKLIYAFYFLAFFPLS